MPKRITANARKKLPKLKSLAQQNADFTAEGSPPPGRVSSEPPMTGTDTPAQPTRPAPKS